MKEGTLVQYDQTTEAVVEGDGTTFNALAVGNAFGPEGNMVIAVRLIDINMEYWAILGETVSKGDPLESGTTTATGTAVGETVADQGTLIAMSSGVAGESIPVQKKL
jgi:hypothetical protein